MARKVRVRDQPELPPGATVRVFERHPRREPTPPPEGPAKVDTFTPIPEAEPDDT